VIAEHPEYIPLLESSMALGAEFTPEGARENPFLHMGLHLALALRSGGDYFLEGM
jgi:hypothetical protein